ncbi:MAG: Stp1/IreP family PP2C-type Ser/Thr phosphatase [Clostridia bacterium]|nr:Stp1/IreP family PP2C-type Ser/Thr phosphatase [Clostridia bacterium]
MQIFFKTDVGLVRSCNQDSCRFGSISDTCAWSVVCDGMGGARGGSVASAEAVEEISRILCEGFSFDLTDEQLKELLVSAVLSANRKVFKMSCENENLKGMGTTVELALISENTLHVVHAGDSRVYLINKDEITQVTTDHSLVQQMVDRGQITAEEARVHPGKNYITRALGVESELEVDYIVRPIGQGDILLMCTDGLSNYFEPHELFETVNKTPNEELAEALVEAAKERGGSDNITVTVLVN